KLARIRDEVGLRELIVTKVTDFAPLPVRWLAPIRFRKEARALGEPWPPVPADAPVRWWGRAVREAGPTPPAASPGPDDLAGLIYTGGRPAWPKARCSRTGTWSPTSCKRGRGSSTRWTAANPSCA